MWQTTNDKRQFSSHGEDIGFVMFELVSYQLLCWPYTINDSLPIHSTEPTDARITETETEAIDIHTFYRRHQLAQTHPQRHPPRRAVPDANHPNGQTSRGWFSRAQRMVYHAGRVADAEQELVIQKQKQKPKTRVT